MSPSIRLILALTFLSTVLTACKVGPNYKRPDLAMPNTFRDAPASPDVRPIADQPWWEVFGDPTLVSLIDEALRSNHDLRIAVARIEQVRGLRLQPRSDLFPQLSYEGSVSRGKNTAGGGAIITSGVQGQRRRATSRTLAC